MAKRAAALTTAEIELRRAQGRARTRRLRALRRTGDHNKLLDARRALLESLTPEEKLERRRAQGRERSRRIRDRERHAAASSPEELERLRAKWRATAAKAYAREKKARELSPEEQERFREKWRVKAAKAYAREKRGRELSPEEQERFREKWRAREAQAYAREIAGRQSDAPEHLRKLAAKRREHRRHRAKKKYSESLIHRISVVLRSRLRSAVRNGQKRGSAIRDLGCSVDDLKSHLERLFRRGMDWENFGHGEGCWNIDHFFPLKRADLSDRAHVLAVCNWRNLRPEWSSENVRKSARVTPAAKALFDELVAHFRSAESAAPDSAGRSPKPRGN